MTTDNTGRRLLDLVGAYNVSYGREDSFKMAPGRLYEKRLLLGIRTRDIPAQAVLDIATGIGMPAKYFSTFGQNLREANLVLFGVEETENGCIYKAYLEFWDKVRREVRATGKRDPLLLHLGFKWHDVDSTISVVARYTCYPMLDVASILARMREIYQGWGNRSSCQIALNLVEFAAKRNAGNFIYVEVSEEDTRRRSFDINFYKSNLTLAEVHPFLRGAAEHYAIAREQFDALCSRNRARLLGHLSGGVARDGGDFLTVYYETRQL
jgi:hypothetical protein